jgi:hypothetical protein
VLQQFINFVYAQINNSSTYCDLCAQAGDRICSKIKDETDKEVIRQCFADLQTKFQQTAMSFINQLIGTFASSLLLLLLLLLLCC